MIFLLTIYISCAHGFSQQVGIGITAQMAPLHIVKYNETMWIEGTSHHHAIYNIPVSDTINTDTTGERLDFKSLVPYLIELCNSIMVEII